MSQTPKKTLLKPAADTEAEESSAANDLSEAELQLIHDGFAALREMGDAEEAEKKEHKSVRALIAYTACDFGVNEEVIRTQVKRHFALSDVNELQGSRFDELVRFLETLDVKQLIN